MAESFSRHGRRRSPARSRSPSAARSRSSSASCCCRASRRRTATSRARCCASSRSRGCGSRYGDPTPAEAIERLEFELGVIARDGLRVLLPDRLGLRQATRRTTASRSGPGRGSAAGSIVAYALEITDLDPLANDLLFERFLNPGRKSMPDIDIDFSVRGRERVIRYVADKYGRESVAQIITFGKMAPRAATRDAARVLGLRLRDRRPARQADPRADHGPQPELRGVPEAGRGAEAHLRLRPATRRRSSTSRAGPRGHRPQQLDPRRRGRDRRPAAHGDRPAAARRGPRRRQRQRERERQAERAYKTVTQYSMGPIEEIGLLKMDFLGLRNLDVIEDAVDIIERSRGEQIDMEAHPARRRQDLRDARAGRLGRRLPVRVRGHARRAQAGPPDRVRGHRRARRPLPARGDALHPRTTRAASATRTPSATPTPACARSPSRPTAA